MLNTAAIIIKILALSGSIILHFLSELEGPSLPMKLIVVPEGPFYKQVPFVFQKQL